jgi:hypothetical protein
MVPRGNGPSVEELRAAVAVRVDRVGLRPVAREIGLDPKAVVKFLRGSHPRPPTRQKLERWLTERVAPGTEPSSSTVSAALNVLLQGVPPEARADAGLELSACLSAIYAKSKAPLPSWLRGEPLRP